MHVMYGYVKIYDITADTAKDFEIRNFVKEDVVFQLLSS